MRPIHRIIKYMEYAIGIFLAAFLIFGAVGYATGSTPYLVISDYPSSMSPTINYGGLVVVYKVPFNSLSNGDIIAFKDPTGYPLTIVHRVVQILPNCSGGSPCLVTKGDNNVTNPTADPWNVTQKDYLGKVFLIVPYVGYLSPTLWREEGILGYSPLLLIFLVAGFLILMKKESRPDDLRNPSNK
jgi:signal peptidase I